MAMELRISSTILDRITAEAIASPDREICGLLLGTGEAIMEARSCRNVAADPAMRFEIDPAALLAAHRAARRGGPAVIGHYHSHPSGLAEPSPRDAADAAPDGSVWLIAAGRDVTGWVAVENGTLHGRFVPLRLRRTAGRATG